MFFTKRKPYLAKNIREILISETSNLPYLHRLCSQYDFVVAGINERSATPKNYRLIEIKTIVNTSENSQSTINITDDFDSLKALEAYAAANLIDIIQHYFDVKSRPQDIHSSKNNVA